MAWKFKPAAGLFDEAAKDWDSLNARAGNHLLLDSRFVGPLLRNFDQSKVMLGINCDSSSPGMALVTKKNIGIWETFQPSQAPIGLIVLGYRDETGEGLLDFVRSLPGYALGFAVLQQDPDHTCVPDHSTVPQLER